jgi:hypothetical protein
MKISERKHRLRTRGIVPVPQEAEPRRRGPSAPAAVRSAGKSASTQKGSTQARPKARWQPSAGTQLAFGLAYVVFAPVLFFENFMALHAHNAKYHPGAFELIMPVVFFLFGVWWVYRGLSARRKKAAEAAATTTAAPKTELAKGSSR